MGTVRGDGVTVVAPVDDFYADLDRWSSTEGDGPTVDMAAVQLEPPVPGTARVICVGLNYAMHIAETNSERPEFPNLFSKFRSTLVGDGADVPVPPGDHRFDYEGELAAVVGHTGTDEAAVFAYTCFNDLTARTWQKSVTQWTLGKNADRSGPIGPTLVTGDELGDPYDLTLVTRRNGDEMQNTNTGLMYFRAADVLDHVAKVMTVLPGDVIALGTPSGVGYRREPPVHLGPGDTVEVEIDGIGVLTTHITKGLT
ncbi:MAG: fumarylacetoacetate hydrolase family protein [Acidimicrobiales bacterium]